MSSINIGKKNYKGKQEGVNDYVDYMVSRRMGEYEAHMKGEKNFHDAKKVIYSGSVPAENVEEAIDSLYESEMIAEQGLSAHLSDTSNPHGVTAEQVGLGNVDNTSDADKPVSAAQAAAIGEKTDKVDFLAHLADKGNPHAVTKASIGLSNADNTSDEDKPLSKAAREEFADNTRKWNAAVTEVSGRLGTHLSDTSNPHGVTAEQVGLGNVDNTSDADKPVSTAQAATLALKTDNEDFESHIADFAAHKTDADAHEEAFAAERARFNPLYCNALFGSAEGASITVSDAVEGTPLALTLYGKCTETLSDSSAEKSPDNPAVITGIGESGSVTVTVTDADGAVQTPEVSVSKPLYDLRTNFSWSTRQDKITSEGIYIQTNRISLDTIKFLYIGTTYVDGCTEFFTSGFDNGINAMRHGCKLLITHFGGYSYHNNPNKDTDNIWAELTGGGNGRFRIIVRDSFLNLTDTDTVAEKIEKLQNWFTAQKDAGTPVEMIYGLETVRFESSEKVGGLPAPDTAATITNSDGADMSLTYNRDINKALAEINNAVAALGTV